MSYSTEGKDLLTHKKKQGKMEVGKCAKQACTKVK